MEVSFRELVVGTLSHGILHCRIIDQPMMGFELLSVGCTCIKSIAESRASNHGLLVACVAHRSWEDRIIQETEAVN